MSLSLHVSPRLSTSHFISIHILTLKSVNKLTIEENEATSSQLKWVSSFRDIELIESSNGLALDELKCFRVWVKAIKKTLALEYHEIEFLRQTNECYEHSYCIGLRSGEIRLENCSPVGRRLSRWKYQLTLKLIYLGLQSSNFELILGIGSCKPNRSLRFHDLVDSSKPTWQASFSQQAQAVA